MVLVSKLWPNGRQTWGTVEVGFALSFNFGLSIEQRNGFLSDVYSRFRTVIEWIARNASQL